MPERRKLHEGAQMATNTKHRERRSMAETPASAGDNGADAAPADTTQSFTHAQSSSFSLIWYVHTFCYVTTLLTYGIKKIILYYVGSRVIVYVQC